MKTVGLLLTTRCGQNQLCLVKVSLYGPKFKISYILVNGLMANFEFWGYRTIFEGGHRCKKNSWRSKFSSNHPKIENILYVSK